MSIFYNIRKLSKNEAEDVLFFSRTVSCIILIVTTRSNSKKFLTIDNGVCARFRQGHDFHFFHMLSEMVDIFYANIF